jgi:hypothetical protein
MVTANFLKRNSININLPGGRGGCQREGVNAVAMSLTEVIPDGACGDRDNYLIQALAKEARYGPT